MGKEWGIEFIQRSELQPVLVNRLLFVLVSNGSKYGAGPHAGFHQITTTSGAEEISCHDESEQTEKLADISEWYRGYDLTNSNLTIHLFHSCSPQFTFFVSVSQNSDQQSVISIETDTSYVETQDEYNTFIDLCTVVFERLELDYGRYVDEYSTPLSSKGSDCLLQLIQPITYFSDDYVEKMSRQRLLSSPVDRVTELEGGGILLDINQSPYGADTDTIESIRDFLG